MSAAPVLDQLAYPPAQAAQVLGLSRTKVDELVRSGELPSIKLGTGRSAKRLIRREALVAWLDRLEREAS